MSKLATKTYSEAMLDIVHQYLADGGVEPIDLDELARYAINNGFWEKHGSKTTRRHRSGRSSQDDTTTPDWAGQATAHRRRRRAPVRRVARCSGGSRWSPGQSS